MDWSALMVARRGAVVAVLTVVLLTLTLPAQAARPAATRPGDDGWVARRIDQGGLPARDTKLVAGLPSGSKLAYHPQTRRVRSLSGTPNRPLTAAVAALASGDRHLTAGDARGKARAFMDSYGALFGLKAPRRELRVRSTRVRVQNGSTGREQGAQRAAGASRHGATVRFTQLHKGVPVLGGEIVVQVAPSGEVISAAGEVLPTGASATTKPRIAVGRARAAAATWLAREAGRLPGAVRVRSEGLGLYDPRLMGDPVLAASGIRLVWQIDARLPASAGERLDHRLVLVDAIGGGVLTTISRIHRADRRVCDNHSRVGLSYRCRAPFDRIEDQEPVGVVDVDAAYDLMGVVDSFFRERFGRDGIDGQGGAMKATVRHCPSAGCPWNNAQWHWFDQQAVFGKRWVRADDIVGHEFTHGLLDHEAPLFYHYQSGALNESLADIFGELIDLTHAGGTDTPWTRWKIGEDTPRGAFRDMRYPGRFGHPDRVRSPRWHTSSSDFGGVHRNSGVGNKAASLIADGGDFRGFQIKGIGLARTARIYYQAVTTRLTSASDYIDLADALVAACADLAGSYAITVGHCKSVSDATRATQMTWPPKVSAPQVAPLCGNGKRPVDVFNDDLEEPAGSPWKTQRLAGNKRGWYYPQNPNNNPAWDGSWASSGELNFYAPDRPSRSDTVMTLTQPQRLPPGAFLRFEHGYGFDAGARGRYDGGIVQIKVDDGPWRGVKALFTHGGYNGTIARGRGNPLAGKAAFTGLSRGWSSARLDLSRFAGRSIKLRFRMGSDRSLGSFGWYIDDVRIYVCASDSTRPTGSLAIDAGAPTTADPEVSVALTANDAGTWITKVRMSNSSALRPGGILLRDGLTMPMRDHITWDLSEPAWGGDPGLGNKRVYAQVRDAAGNWSRVFSDDIELVAGP